MKRLENQILALSQLLEKWNEKIDQDKWKVTIPKRSDTPKEGQWRRAFNRNVFVSDDGKFSWGTPPGFEVSSDEKKFVDVDHKYFFMKKMENDRHEERMKAKGSLKKKAFGEAMGRAKKRTEGSVNRIAKDLGYSSHWRGSSKRVKKVMEAFQGELMKEGEAARKKSYGFSMKIGGNPAWKSKSTEAAIGFMNMFSRSLGPGKDDRPDNRKLADVKMRQTSHAKPRAYFIGGYKKPRITVGTSSHVLWHEMGHWLEGAANKRIEDAGRHFLLERTKDDKLERLKTVTGIQTYRSNEFCLKDKFTDPYVGKIYGGNPHTEVVSMAVERLKTPKYMADLYRRDPEHFHLAIAVATGEFGWG